MFEVTLCNVSYITYQHISCICIV